jgi:hypothetical protein
MMLNRVAEPPLVWSTSQGSARKVMALPVLETASATSSAISVRFLKVI